VSWFLKYSTSTPLDSSCTSTPSGIVSGEKRVSVSVADSLDDFYLAHRRCGALTSGPYGEDGCACSCGASILVPPNRPELAEPVSGDDRRVRTTSPN